MQACVAGYDLTCVTITAASLAVACPTAAKLKSPPYQHEPLYTESIRTAQKTVLPTFPLILCVVSRELLTCDGQRVSLHGRVFTGRCLATAASSGFNHYVTIFLHSPNNMYS